MCDRQKSLGSLVVFFMQKNEKGGKDKKGEHFFAVERKTHFLPQSLHMAFNPSS